MELQIIKKTKKDKNIYSEKLNVAAYVRVSTELENQIFSFESQQKYYKDRISNNCNWNLVDIYSDNGITGRDVTKRKEFQRMIYDALDGKIDLILTKSVSRFARNTNDLLRIVRLLRTKDVAVYFEEERINTLSMESELLLTVLASVAEQESLNTSSHVKLGVKVKMLEGKIVSPKKRLGYETINGNFVINKKEAKTIKKIFELYASGMRCQEVVDYLNKKKILTITKSKWTKTSIRGIIRNELYAGDLLQGKSYMTFENGKERQVRNYDKSTMYLVENHHEAIVSRDLFNKANELMDKKSKPNEKYKSIFSGKFYCGFCNRAIQIKRVENNHVYYACTNYRNKDSIEVIVKEDFIEDSFNECIKKLSHNKYRKEILLGLTKYKNEKNKINVKLSYYQDTLNKYIDLYNDNKINYGKFDYERTINNEKIEELNNELKTIDKMIEDYGSIIKTMNNIFNIIDQDYNSFDFDINLFNKIISFVIIGGYSEKGTKLPYMIRFIVKQKENLFEEKVTENLDNLKLPTINTVATLDFRNINKSRIRSNNNFKIINSHRVRFEIER